MGKKDRFYLITNRERVSFEELQPKELGLFCLGELLENPLRTALHMFFLQRMRIQFRQGKEIQIVLVEQNR